MISQQLSFSLGILMCLLNVWYFKRHYQEKWQLIFWLLFWGSYVVFYVWVLFISEGGQVAHEISSFVRVFRNSLLAGWFLSHYWGKRHGN